MSGSQWFAAYTYPRHEKKVATYLEHSGIESFLPLYKEAHCWKNGLRVTVEKPLFPGYVFVHVATAETLKVLRTPSVASMVTVAGVPAPLSDQEIQALKASVEKLQLEPHPYLKKGDRVRVKSGPLQDKEGILVFCKNRWRVVICIDLLMRAVAVEIEQSELDRVPERVTRAA